MTITVALVRPETASIVGGQDRSTYRGAVPNLTLASQSTSVSASGQLWADVTRSGSDDWEVAETLDLLASLASVLTPAAEALAALIADAQTIAATARSTLVGQPTPALTTLAALAQAGDREGFLRALEHVGTARWPAEALVRAVDLALHLDLVEPAAALAREGVARFPGEERLARAVRVLTPGAGRASVAERPGGLSASQAWLRDHAAPYRGQWVVVRDGVLLGASADLAALRDLITRENDPATTIITRVL